MVGEKKGENKKVVLVAKEKEKTFRYRDDLA